MEIKPDYVKAPVNLDAKLAERGKVEEARKRSDGPKIKFKEAPTGGIAWSRAQRSSGSFGK